MGFKTVKTGGRVVVALILAGVIASASAAISFAAFSEKAAGTRTAQFLKLPVGAKYIAMGEAATAVADDANAIYYNVAGLARVEKKSAEYMYGGLLLKDKVSGESNPGQHWIAYAMPIEGIGSAGIAIQLLNVGDISKTDITATSKGTFAPRDLAVNFSYARKLMEIPLGLNIKIVNSKIEESATTVGFDLGAQHMMDKLMLGFAVQNLGGKLKFETESSKLPILIKLGAGYKAMENWVAALDIVFPEDNSPVLALGTDYMHKISEEISLSGRVGYNTRNRKVDGFNGLNIGVGFWYKMAGLDIAWSPMGDLGQTIRFSVGVKF